MVILKPDWDGKRTYFRIKKRYDKAKSELGRSIVNQQMHRLMRKFSADIPANLALPKSTVFPHGLNGIFISHGATIGDNVTIFQQVTIGSNTISGHPRFGAPTIGNNVYIGAGAKIIGKCSVGNNARIGANCVVVEDIPENATVVLEKPRLIVHLEKRDNTFSSWGEKK